MWQVENVLGVDGKNNFIGGLMFGLQNGSKKTLDYIDNRMDSFTNLIRSCFKDQTENNKKIEDLQKFAMEATKALGAMGETIKAMQRTLANTLDIQEMLVSSVEVKSTKTPAKKKRTKK